MTQAIYSENISNETPEKVRKETRQVNNKKRNNKNSI